MSKNRSFPEGEVCCPFRMEAFILSGRIADMSFADVTEATECLKDECAMWGDIETGHLGELNGIPVKEFDKGCRRNR